MFDILITSALIVLAYSFLSYLLNTIIRNANWDWWYYNLYLKSFHWKITRWRKKFQMWLLKGSVFCEKCKRNKFLAIHHITYKRIGRERLSDLQVICFYCHRPGGGRI